jgi:hypothetical protein
MRPLTTKRSPNQALDDGQVSPTVPTSAPMDLDELEARLRKRLDALQVIGNGDEGCARLMKKCSLCLPRLVGVEEVLPPGRYYVAADS